MLLVTKTKQKIEIYVNNIKLKLIISNIYQKLDNHYLRFKTLSFVLCSVYISLQSLIGVVGIDIALSELLQNTVVSYRYFLAFLSIINKSYIHINKNGK